jgi:hypothetical protein
MTNETQTDAADAAIDETPDEITAEEVQAQETAVEDLTVSGDRVEETLVEETLVEEEPIDEASDEFTLRLEALREEFGDALTDVIVDAEFDEAVAEFLIGANDRLGEVIESTRGRASFYLHREPGPKKDHYILRTVRPQEFKAQWVTMISGQPEAFERYEEEFLRAVMLYPSFDEVDWDWDDDTKLHSPDAFTKGRLVSKYFDFTLPDPQAPSGVAFGASDVGPAVDVARRKKKPSL